MKREMIVVRMQFDWYSMYMQCNMKGKEKKNNETTNANRIANENETQYEMV